MKKIVYPFALLALVLVLSSAVNSFHNQTLVLPPDNSELILPDVPFEYEMELPEHIVDFISGWGVSDPNAFNSITNDGATLGRVLFYDVRLSADNTLSCASCHKQANSFSDDVALSDGIADQLTTRNSMSLNDLGWQLGNAFFWDMRTADLQDAVVQPILAAHELGKNMEVLIAKLEATEEYGALFQAAYGSSDIDEIRIANSLMQFIQSMTSFESRYDQHLMGNNTALNASELAGLNSFEENCSFCHITPHFGSIDPFFFFPGGNNGLDSVFTDLGMGAWMGDEFFNGVFKSPTLRNIEVTAPYMHDGRFETLEDVIDFYSEGVQSNENSSFNWMFGEDFTGYDFSEGEKTDLLNFLKALTDQELLTNEKWSNPWNSTVSNDEVELEGVQVFPNPVADMVTVEFTNPRGEPFDIRLFDMKGRLVKSFQTNADILEIPRANLPAGTYELQATDGKAQKTFKVIYQ